MKTFLPIVLVVSSLSSCIFMPEYWALKEQQQIQPQLQAEAEQKGAEVAKLQEVYKQKEQEKKALEASINKKKREIAALERRIAQREQELREQQRQLELAQSGVPIDEVAEKAEIEKMKEEVEAKRREVKKHERDFLLLK